MQALAAAVEHEVAELQFGAVTNQRQSSLRGENNIHRLRRQRDIRDPRRRLLSTQQAKLGQLHPGQAGAEFPRSHHQQVEHLLQACLIAVGISEYTGAACRHPLLPCRASVSDRPLCNSQDCRSSATATMAKSEFGPPRCPGWVETSSPCLSILRFPLGSVSQFG